MLFLLTACVITEADVQERLDFDGDGYVHWEFEGGTDCDDADPDVNPGVDDACDGVDSNCDGVAEDLTDADGDGVTVCGGDCDDDDPDRAPGQTEACDGIDNDCDGILDEGLPERSFFRDADADGFGDPEAPPVLACFPPSGYVDDDADCDDGDHTLNPDTVWYRDIDADGFGDEGILRNACEQPVVAGVTYVRTPGDCNDDDGAIYPGRIEVGDPDLVCNGVDDDCDPTTAPDELVDGDGDGFPACADCGADDDAHQRPDLVWWSDGDGDGFGSGSSTTGCPTDPHFVLAGGDCDDADPHRSPGTVWYRDGDHDGAGDPTSAITSCDDPSSADSPYIRVAGDCDDADGTAFPGNDDLGVRACNGVDNDCDPLTAPDELVDADTDGFPACEDCGNDDDGHVTPAMSWYVDADGDGVGTGAAQLGCPDVPSWSERGDDCDDAAALVSSTDFEVASGTLLAPILAQVCPDTTITLAAGFTTSESLTFPRAVTVVAAGSATATGDVSVEHDVQLTGLDIVGDVTVANAALGLTDVSLDGALTAHGASTLFERVEVSLTGDVGMVLSESLVDWVDVSVDATLPAMSDVVVLENAAPGSRLLRVRISGSGNPMMERYGLRIRGIAPGGADAIGLRNVLVTDVTNGLEVSEHDADLQFVTVADYFARGLLLRGDGNVVSVVDSLVGRPYVPPEGGTPPGFGGIEVDAEVLASFDTTFTFVTDVEQAAGIGVDDPTGAFAACAAELLPSGGGGDGPPRCEIVDTRVDDVQSDLTVTSPMMMEAQSEHLYGRIQAFGVDCFGVHTPGPGIPPDPCFQPGYYGGNDAPDEP